jgi:hypothetical protein
LDWIAIGWSTRSFAVLAAGVDQRFAAELVEANVAVEANAAVA